MECVRVNGVDLHYRIDGPDTAPWLVFANSLGTDFRIWDGIVGRLGDRVRTLRYDMRGHGLSSCPEGPYSIDDLTDDLIGLLDHVGAETIALCGLSVGGMTAQRLAHRAPERLAALILCDTALKIGPPSIWDERIALVQRDGLEAVLDPVMERWFTADFRANDPTMPLWRSMVVRQPVQGYVATCQALKATDLTDGAGGISLPTLVVVGDSDGSTPPDMVRTLADAIPGARFEIIAQAAHIPCVEQPDALASLISAFLADASHV